MTKTTMIVVGLLLACGATPTEHAGHGEAKAKEASVSKSGAADPHAAHREPSGAIEEVYDLRLSSEPSPPQPRAKTRLVLDPRRPDGSRVDRLAIVHEKPLHLLLVSRDLSFFAHEHPAPEDGGTYALDFAFPDPGEYVLFGDFTPEGAPGQVVRMPLSVAGDAPPPRPLGIDDRRAPKRFGDFAVELGPSEIRASADTMLSFTIGDDPNLRLRPYLGAMGHCVVIDETATTFLHSHPMEAEGGPGNVVQFHTVFPTPGKYKIWGQFDVDGEMLIADFVVDVH